MIESSFQGKIIDRLKETGCEILNLHGHAMQASGWPDIYVASRMWTGWIEFKMFRTSYKEHQRLRLKRLNERGVPAFVFRMNDEETEYMIQTWDEVGLWELPLGTRGLDLLHCLIEQTAILKTRGILRVLPVT